MEFNKKSEIIKQAHGLFMMKGYHGTSILDIAKNTEITKSQIYYYFDSKQDIGVAVIKQEIEYMNKNIVDLTLYQNMPAEKKLYSILKNFYDISIQKHDGVFYGFLLGKIFSETATEVMEFRSLISSAYIQWRNTLQGILEELNLDLPGTNLEHATFILNTLMGASQNMRVMESCNVMKPTVDNIAYFYLGHRKINYLNEM